MIIRFVSTVNRYRFVSIIATVQGSVVGLAIALLLVVVNGCKKEEDVLPAPTVTMSQATVEAAAGQQITISASVSAPAGLKTVTITRNGAAFDTKTFTGETTAAYSNTYTIEKTQPLGSQIVFTILATDNANQTSQASTLVVTISPKPIVTVTGSITTNTTWTNDKVYKIVWLCAGWGRCNNYG